MKAALVFIQVYLLAVVAEADLLTEQDQLLQMLAVLAVALELILEVLLPVDREYLLFGVVLLVLVELAQVSMVELVWLVVEEVRLML
jgi:hypothetical protein